MAKRKKKLGKRAQFVFDLKESNAQLIRELSQQTSDANSLRASVDLLTGQLHEARRRTIPFGDGKHAINLLPIAVTDVVIDNKFNEFHSLSGFTQKFLSHRTCKVTLVASMLPGEEPLNTRE